MKTILKLIIGALMLPLALIGQPTTNYANMRISGTNNVVLDAGSLKFGTTTPGNISGAAGAIAIAAAGTNQNITLTPSGNAQVRIVDASTANGLTITNANNVAAWAIIRTGGLFLRAAAGTAGAGLVYSSSGNLGFSTAASETGATTERARFASSGNLLLGGLTTDGGSNKVLQIPSTNVVNFGATANATIGVSADTTAGLLQIVPPSAGMISLAGATGGTSQALSGAGAVNVTTLITNYTSTGGAQALTLADGTDGQIKVICHVVDGGSGVLTPTTKTGFSTITFTNAGDSVTLKYTTTTGWFVIGSYGATIAP